MHEAEADIAELQGLLDRSHAGAGGHLRSIFSEPPDAAALCEQLVGIFEMHLAVLAGDGAPLVAPVDAVFFRGRIWFGLPGASLRARLVARDDRVSASYTQGKLAVIVHGVVHPATSRPELERDYTDVVVRLYTDAYGAWWPEWHADQVAKERASGTSGYTGFIEPRVMFVQLPG